MPDSIRVERRFRGPPDSGNGGYVGGRLAAFVEGPAVVRLQVPPPLGVDMAVRPAAAGVELVHAGTVVAWARPAPVTLQVPAAPGYAEAEAAARNYRGFRSHPFPACFVCGPERGPGDGLRIFPGKVDGAGVVASPWVPDASLADGKGIVRREFLWSALDCPGAFSFEFQAGHAVLLGELAVSLDGTVAAGERCVVIGWELGRDGRKHRTGTALFAESGRCVGAARATWFQVPMPGGRDTRAPRDR